MLGGVEASAYINCWMKWKHPCSSSKSCKAHHRILSTPTRRKRLPVYCSKTLDYQDSQDYARPLRLLPVTKANIRTQSPLEEMSTLKVAESRSMYMVKLHTSTASGSCLSDLNAGILLCFIDENGDSVLQRLTAIPEIPSGMEIGVQDFLCFQRGSVNEFTFEGPKLGRIEALWVGLESGRWRFGGVNLTVIYGGRVLSNETEEEVRKVHADSGLRYDFKTEDIVFGGSGDVSVVELRPYHITELSGAELSASLDMNSRSTTLLDSEISNEETMREYADLKSSLLIYDSMLILAGSMIAAISSGEKAALSFLIGGAGGFLYLLLLQNSVDRIPAPALISMNREEENLNQLFGRVKGPIWILALAFVFAVVGLKYGSGASPIELTAQDILVGMAGFLSCKVAVVLAAFNPIQVELKDK